jgi:Ca2+-binding EF-hand superfamily protein
MARTVNRNKQVNTRLSDDVSPLISVKEFRKMLGVSARTMNDDEVRQLLEDYDNIAKVLIASAKVLKNN